MDPTWGQGHSTGVGSTATDFNMGDNTNKQGSKQAWFDKFY